MQTLSPAQRRKRAMARAQVTVSGYPARGDLLDRPGAIHRRDAMANMRQAAEDRALALTFAIANPIAACRYAISARNALRGAAVCNVLALSHGFSLPAGA